MIWTTTQEQDTHKKHPMVHPMFSNQNKNLKDFWLRLNVGSSRRLNNIVFFWKKHITYAANHAA